jgi:hypothetical protein
MNVIEILITEIDSKVSQLQEYVGTGRADTFEEYKKTCGEIKGLLTARGYALDLQKRLEQADE